MEFASGLNSRVKIGLWSLQTLSTIPPRSSYLRLLVSLNLRSKDSTRPHGQTKGSLELLAGVRGLVVSPIVIVLADNHHLALRREKSAFPPFLGRFTYDPFLGRFTSQVKPRNAVLTELTALVALDLALAVTRGLPNCRRSCPRPRVRRVTGFPMNLSSKWRSCETPIRKSPNFAELLMSGNEREHGQAAESWPDELRRTVLVQLCVSTRKPELSASQAGSLTHPPPQGLTMSSAWQCRPRGLV